MQCKLNNWLLVIATCMMGCGSSNSFSLKEYLQQADKQGNNISSTVSTNGLNFTAFYTPPIVMGLREAGSIDALTKNYSSLLKNYEGREFFELRLVKPGESTRKFLQRCFISTDSSQSAFEEYIDFDIQRDIHLIAGADTLPCAYMHREISEAITNDFRYTLSFDITTSKNNNFKKEDQLLLLHFEKLGLSKIEIMIQQNQIALLNNIKP